jgi:hypothetical protein
MGGARATSSADISLSAARTQTPAQSLKAAGRLTAARRTVNKHDLTAQVVGQFGSAREISNGGASAAPVGLVI